MEILCQEKDWRGLPFLPSWGMEKKKKKETAR